MALLSGCRLEVPAGRTFEGVKKPERAIQKACRAYGGRCNLLLDLLRATLVADDAASMLKAMQLLDEPFDDRLSIRRVKNRFQNGNEGAGGFRNLHVNIVLSPSKHSWCSSENTVDTSWDPAFVCELQIQHKQLWDAEQAADREEIDENGNTIVCTAHDRYIAYRDGRAD